MYFNSHHGVAHFFVQFLLKVARFFVHYEKPQRYGKDKSIWKSSKLAIGGQKLRLFQLARGSAIKVLYPQWLADAVKQQHQEAANLYE